MLGYESYGQTAGAARPRLGEALRLFDQMSVEQMSATGHARRIQTALAE